MMAKKQFWLFAFVSLLSLSTTVRGAEAPESTTAAEVRALAERIDKHLAESWRANNVEPAAAADDAEFLRRAFLDLAGRIPSVAETRAFLRDTTPDKRDRLVERLLASPRYITHWVNVWRALLLPETLASRQARVLSPGFETWLRGQLEKNAGYDVMVRELLTTPVGNTGGRGMGFGRGQASNPLAYFQTKETKPENLAAAVSRVFLGFRLECAQCHDHPFAEWKRDQFWSLAAFFSGMETQLEFPFQMVDVPDKKQITILGTERVVQAKFPNDAEPVWNSEVTTRQTLADWVTAPQNPYFARATVNRLWFQLFGRGLIDPVDEMFGGSSSIASESKLLDEVAVEFAAHHFDLKFLIRTLTSTRAYQLTSAGQNDLRLFARMPLRGLSSEQLQDSLVQATGHPDSAPRDPNAFVNTNTPRDELLTNFTEQIDQPTEVETTILQALALMNGRLIADQTTLARSDLLASIVDAPFLSHAQQIETMYLATLSRRPRPNEIARAAAFIDNFEGADRETARKQALADIFWALLNSGEFLLNH